MNDNPIPIFLGWLAEWNMHRRRAQRLLVAAVIASVYTDLESQRKNPREIVRLLDSGLLGEQMTELLRSAVAQLDKLELQFEQDQGRLPTAPELLQLAREEAEKELRQELTGWDLPF